MPRDCTECRRLWRNYTAATTGHVQLEASLRLASSTLDQVSIHRLRQKVAIAGELTGCGKSKLGAWLLKHNHIELFYARARSSAVSNVQLLVAGATCPVGPPLACGASNGRHDLGATVT